MNKYEGEGVYLIKAKINGEIYDMVYQYISDRERFDFIYSYAHDPYFYEGAFPDEFMDYDEKDIDISFYSIEKTKFRNLWEVK